MRIFWISLLSIQCAVGCGSKDEDEATDGLDCGEGTHEEDGTCVADATTDADDGPSDVDADDGAADDDGSDDGADDADADSGPGTDTIEIAGTWIDINEDINVITDSSWSYSGYTDPILDFSNDEDWVITTALGQYYRTRWVWESDTRWYWCVSALSTSLDELEDYGPIEPDDLESGCAGDIWAPMDRVGGSDDADADDGGSADTDGGDDDTAADDTDGGDDDTAADDTDGGDDDTAADDTDDGGSPDTDGGDDDTDGGETELGFGVTGMLLDPFTGLPGSSGICLAAADPSPALVGGDLAILATGMTEEAGAFEITGIETASTLGIVIIAHDCEGADTTMYPSGTGISSYTYGALADGEIASSNIFQLTTDIVGTIDADLITAGHTDSDGAPATFSEQGGLIAFMFDAEGSPVPGATLDCAAGSCPAYYNTADMMGSFSLLDTEGEPGTSTGLDGLAVLPGAPITTYLPTHPTLAFDSLTTGSLPGIALFFTLSSDDVLGDDGV